MVIDLFFSETSDLFIYQARHLQLKQGQGKLIVLIPDHIPYPMAENLVRAGVNSVLRRSQIAGSIQEIVTLDDNGL